MFFGKLVDGSALLESLEKVLVFLLIPGFAGPFGQIGGVGFLFHLEFEGVDRPIEGSDGFDMIKGAGFG